MKIRNEQDADLCFVFIFMFFIFKFVIRSSEEPSMVHEMVNRDGEVVSIFEVYYNSTSQRVRIRLYFKQSKKLCLQFVVYNPKTKGIKLPERMEPFVEKEEPAARKYRNADDLLAGPRCDQLGYRRMTQFINLAKHRVARGKIHHIFEQPEFTLQLKYDGVVSLSSNDGRILLWHGFDFFDLHLIYLDADCYRMLIFFYKNCSS